MKISPLFLVVLPIALLLVFAFVIYHCVSRALDAENTYGDMVDVLRITTSYLEENSEWPKSWDDLERSSVPMHSRADGLPASHLEFENWKKSISFDFNFTRAEVAAMDYESFTAIQPNRSCWPPDYYIKSLLETARRDDGCIVLEALTIYLRNHTEWPKRWADLNEVRVPLKPGGFWMGSDCTERWKKRVVVDFSATRVKVAAMTVDNFSAVKPIRAVYGPREQRIKELLEVARQKPKSQEVRKKQAIPQKKFKDR